MRKKSVDFSKYSSIRLGPTLELSVIENETDAKAFDGVIIGGACNLIVTGKNSNLAVLGDEFDYIRMDGDKLFVGAGTMGGRVFSFAKKHDLSGLEFMGGLPGSVGGMLSMNAGLKEQEIFNTLIKIKFWDGYKEKGHIPHGYRYAQLNGIALEAVFPVLSGFDALLYERLKNLRKNQPTTPSAGSCFKNPPNNYAGKLLEEAGMKGYKIGQMSFSDIHANFLVNLGGGTVDDALEIIGLAQKRVFECFGVLLELEIRII